MTLSRVVRETGDLQNRLGFVVSLARQVASSLNDAAAASALAVVELALERSRLVREDTLCREHVPGRTTVAGLGSLARGGALEPPQRPAR